MRGSVIHNTYINKLMPVFRPGQGRLRPQFPFCTVQTFASSTYVYQSFYTCTPVVGTPDSTFLEYATNSVFLHTFRSIPSSTAIHLLLPPLFTLFSSLSFHLTYQFDQPNTEFSIFVTRSTLTPHRIIDYSIGSVILYFHSYYLSSGRDM